MHKANVEFLVEGLGTFGPESDLKDFPSDKIEELIRLGFVRYEAVQTNGKKGKEIKSDETTNSGE